MKITDFKSLNMLKPVLCYVSLYILYLMFQFVAVFYRRQFVFQFVFICFIIITVCGSGKYGVNCLETCSSYCVDPHICHHQGGVCDCVKWATGKTCDHMIGRT